MVAHRLQPLIAPTSLAVVGATRREGRVGNEVLVNLRKGQYPGSLYAVNPGYEEILGIPCYESLQALPEVPEHVIFALGDQHIEVVLAEAIQLGVKAVSIYSSLELEDDSAPLLKERVHKMIVDAGIVLSGANGMGVYNFHDHVWNCGFHTRDHPHPGNVVLLSQSGSAMAGILDCDERIDFLYAASTGQELVVSIEDHLDYVLDLPETRVVGMFLETTRHPHKFIAALKKAQRKQIPIVVVKVGKTDFAARMAVSHSGALAGSDASYQAVFERYGVQRVRDMDELATVLIMFAQPHAIAEGGVVALLDSGGERQLVIDLADELDVDMTRLSAKTTTQLEQLLDPGLPPVNPLDAWGAGGDDADEMMSQCLAAMLCDENAAFGAVIQDRAPFGKIYPSYIEYARRAHQRSGKPVFVVASRQGTGSDEQVLSSTRAGIPVLDGVSQFLVGSRCLLNYRDFLRRVPLQPPHIPQAKLQQWRGRLGSREPLDEATAAQFLGDCGLSMNAYHRADSADTMRLVADSVSFPVVLKTAEPGIAHKSDVGGVVLHLGDAAQLMQAYTAMSQQLGPRVVVTPMVEGAAVEMILGVSRDAQFGPVVVMGFGGIYAEVLQDVAVVLPPFDKAVARRALDGLRMRPLLDGVRGETAVNIDAFCAMAARLSAVAVAFAGEIHEIDINPVRLDSHGVIGLDALVGIATSTGENTV